MAKLIECIPNFSEGRDPKKIQKIRDAISKIKGIHILHVTSDHNHNRTVITFAGEPKAVFKAAFEAVKTAAKLINVNEHTGVHPRIGATDVLPLVPLKNANIKDCLELAKKLSAKIAKDLKIPVYLYEKAASKPERENLSEVRNLGYEKLKDEIGTNPERKPDYGPEKLGSAGAIAIGVREILIAYNVNLASNDIFLAREIARKIRFSNGGLPSIKALGLELANRGIVQVSMNLINYKETGIKKVYDLIKKEAKKEGVEILESEVIGLVPEKALNECGKDYKKYLKLSAGFKDAQILEVALKK
ncbi:glutamate formimidoyltransferase [Candidatus Peregrinibacteria bacterium]|nr:glutamate formimidoyltransferase [Candidatus Peregrinibacteria bacterium]